MMVRSPLVIAAAYLVCAGCGREAEPTTPASQAPAARDVIAEQWQTVLAGKSDTLDLSGVTVTDDDLAPLADRSTSHEQAAVPREVRLGPSRLTERGIARLAAIDSLETLVLGETRLDDAGAAHLAPLPKLRVLNVPLAEITDAGLASLAKMQSLELLRVGSPKVTDAGLAALADHPSLRQLIIVDTPLTDAVLEHVRRMPKLESLYLFNTKISDEALAELQRFVPHVHFD